MASWKVFGSWLMEVVSVTPCVTVRLVGVGVSSFFVLGPVVSFLVLFSVYIPRLHCSCVSGSSAVLHYALVPLSMLHVSIDVYKLLPLSLPCLIPFSFWFPRLRLVFSLDPVHSYSNLLFTPTCSSVLSVPQACLWHLGSLRPKFACLFGLTHPEEWL